MSDWSTAFQGAREGLIAGANLAEQRRARRVQEEFEKQRVGMEQERLGNEKRRVQSEMDTADLERRIKGRVFDPAPPAAPNTSRKSTYSPTTGWSVQDEPVPTADTLNTIKIPGTLSSLVTGPGMTPVPVPQVSPFLQQALGGAAPAPAGGALPDLGTAPGRAVQPPTPPTPAGRGGGQNFGVRRVPEVNGLDVHGNPNITFRYVWEEPDHPHIRMDDSTGRRAAMQATLDPQTGNMAWHPVEQLDPNKQTPKEASVSDLLAALRVVDEFEGAVKRSGNFESVGPGGLWGNPADAAQLDALPVKLSVAMARAMNPGNAPTEAQIAADKHSLVPMGLTVPNAKTMAALGNVRADLLARARERDLMPDIEANFARRGLVFPDEASVEAAGRAGKLSDGDQVMVNGHIAVWHAHK